MTVQKKWDIPPRAPQSHLDRFPDLSPLLVQILYNRRITDVSAVEDLLSNRWSEPDVFDLPDMDRAVDVLIRAVKRQEKIAVYGDFDADGVTATALLVRTLRALGADVMPYIPKRVEEGYGLNLDALRWLYGQGVRLVVTVDCGIRAIDVIEQARRGLEFIVTDHHSIGPRLPFASAVINPKREDSRYPFRLFSGVGVAFKLAQAMLREARGYGMRVEINERSLLSLAAIGTVADLVPLVGENRYLVQQGLKAINEAEQEGIRALLRVSRVRPGEVTASSIGYGLGPRLNAAGRLGDAALSYDLLVCDDALQAEQLAGRLNEQNRKRKMFTEQAYELAEQMALDGNKDAPILFAADKTFMAGVVGLVAGRLTEAYYRPAVIVEQGDDFCRGSCRSIKEFHITKALDECQELLVRHGGHAAAAGFTVRSSDLDRLAQRLREIADRELADRPLAPILSIDAQVDLSDMDWATVEWLDALEPCGYGNPTPLFVSRNLQLLSADTVGRDGRHLKFTLEGDGVSRDAIAFRMGDRLGSLGERVDVAYHLEVNEWGGTRNLQLNVQDIRPST
jgi:single-stranded-DNA-specific exonuclease